MAVKYACTKCDKKFVEWGAKKIKSGKACPDCEGEFLELLGFDASKAAVKKKPALKRKRTTAVAAARPRKAAAGKKPPTKKKATDGAEKAMKDTSDPEGGDAGTEAIAGDADAKKAKKA